MKNIFAALTILLFLSACMGGGTTQNQSYSGNPWERTIPSQTAETEPGMLDPEYAEARQQWLNNGYPASDSGAQQGPDGQTLLTMDSSVERFPLNQSSPTLPGAGSLPPPAAATPAVKVALLVPLSGRSADVGEAILNAAQLALFDIGADSFELIPRDTKGTASGAYAAAQSALNDGAQLVLGPLFAEEVRAVSPIAQSAGVSMIAFTTDWKQAGGNTFVMGFMPFGQIERVVAHATQKGIRTIGVVAPKTDYGNAVMTAFTGFASRAGLTIADTVRYAPGDTTLAPVIQKFAKYDSRMKPDGTFSPPPFDAVFLPAAGVDAQTIANLLSYYELDPAAVRRIGTGLWDDTGMIRETNLNGGWYAAPDPRARKVFEKKYSDAYGSVPPRLASLGYDSTALAAVLARTGKQKNGAPAFDRASIMNPNGFAGIDGIFRFRADGLAERGLAILEIRNGDSVVIDPAPKTFQVPGL